MTARDDEIRRQLRLGEDSAWEFKQVVFSSDRPVSPRRDDLADEIAAFANARGGTLLCGVTDAGEVEGMSRGRMDALERLLVEVCTDSITPSLAVGIERHEIDGKAFVLVDVPAGYAQHDSPGGAFRRIGSSKRRMTSDERLRLAQRRGQARFLWFDEQPVPGTGLKTLDPALWEPLLGVAGRANPRVGLTKMGLLAEGANGTRHATVAGVLLCCPDPQEWIPNACITATRYRGRDRASGQVDAQVIGGPLHRQIREAVAFVVRNMRVGAHKDPARLDLPQYSPRAIFEAVVNAVAHRDYSMRGSRIRLSLFADRLEVQSPGAFPNGLTVDNIADRQATRNEVIASILGRIPVGDVDGSGDRRHFMERRGDGVPVILRETLGASGREAEYRVVGEADVVVIMPSAPAEPSPARVAVTVRAGDRLLPGADVLVLFPNTTWKRAETDASGEAHVDLYTVDLPMTVFVAAPGHAGHVERDWTPARGALAVELAPLPNGGAVILAESTGRVPGLAGTLNPIRDSHDRTYVYASNISIDEGSPQPVHFRFDEDIRLTDANGREVLARIRDIVGRSALVEYRPQR